MLTFMVQNPKLKREHYPNVLYRVHLPGISQTSYSHNMGFKCSARGHIDICNYGDLAGCLSSHLDNDPNQASHFISMFGSRDHAVHWARLKLRHGHATSAMVMEINPAEIKNVLGRSIPILKVSDVVEMYPEMIPYGADERWFDDEYLALYKVPAQAISKCYCI
ncbi:hypothetical protein TWF718_005621 [Orbilia javanica]|uniref:DUF7587 domain-containing protein n=1 Tax=Orbilia javanica TaxID=47235 RepID=A0AAN8NXA0_9PEZI